MKIEKKKLAPTHYKSAAHEQWSERLSAKDQHGHSLKGKFLAHERETEQQELMRRTKKENLPAPGCYSPKQPDTGRMKFSQSERSPAFIDNAVWHSNQSPTVCYKKVEDLTNLVKPRIFALKIAEPSKRLEENKKPKKSDLPDMGSYNPDDSKIRRGPGYS